MEALNCCRPINQFHFTITNSRIEPKTKLACLTRSQPRSARLHVIVVLFFDGSGFHLFLICFVSFCFILFEKVAAVSGDARRCLDICRRAVEIADSQSKKKGTALVGMSHVDAALQDMFSSPKIRAMK